jgi:GAF domain-containing protein
LPRWNFHRSLGDYNKRCSPRVFTFKQAAELHPAQAFSSPGRQIFIFGDRGVGKTSLALTAAYVHTGIENSPIYVMCGKTNNFAQTIQAIGNATIPIQKRPDKLTTGGASAILQDAPWILNDAKNDPRSLANPLVAGDFGLRFYVGVSLRTNDGFNLGTLCVIDRAARSVSEEQIAHLTDLASTVMWSCPRLTGHRAIGSCPS